MITFTGHSAILHYSGKSLQLQSDVQYLISDSWDRSGCLEVDGKEHFFDNILTQIEEDGWSLTFDNVNIEEESNKVRERMHKSFQDTKIYIYEIENKLLHDMALKKGQENNILHQTIANIEKNVHLLERNFNRLRSRIRNIIVNRENDADMAEQILTAVCN
jgi:hypothetical protein